MYPIVSSAELAVILLFAIFSFIAAGKASKLVYQSTEKQLHRRTRKLRFWSVSLTALAVLIAAAGAILAATAHPLFWLDRLFVHAPLALIPVACVWIGSYPRLVRLMSRTNKQSDAQPDTSRRRLASEPAFIFPYRLTSLCSAGLFYFAFVPPIPFDWSDVTIPVTVLLFLASMLWMLQTRRNQLATEAPLPYRPWRRRLKRAAALAAAAAVGCVPFLTAMEGSRLPDNLSMMAGAVDYGKTADGSAPPSGHRHHGAVVPAGLAAGDSEVIPVTELTGPRDGEADRKFTVTAQRKTVKLSSGKEVEAWTYNGQIPGPELRMKEGELVEVTLVNQDIEDGVTLHWHGLDVPNAEDGVAGATQNAVMPGETYTYRFVAEQVGTFWYHSHQHSKEAVQKGLFGALIVDPAEPAAQPQEDITVITHLWDGAGFAIGADDSMRRRTIAPGTTVKLRLINTDDWVRQSYILTGTPFKVTAIDGTDLNGPTELENQSLDLLTGGRYDVAFTMPDRPVALRVGRGDGLGILMTPDGGGVLPALQRTTTFDPTHYGTAAETPFDADSEFDREFTMILDNRFAFYNGRFAAYDTINGAVFPNTPMFVVKKGELVKTLIVNRSAVEHPMHLHGHHMLVLSRNGERVTGSPWWSDTLDVAPGESYEVAFLADNPGVWMDHCHNLVHAAAGMTMHLMYDGVSSPFEIGAGTHNHPE
ncbi:multicopper oxidase family protein [Paenibacillus arenilitoris]|uniref:Multicopper oxidase family protein n=1 Tax=Paenibacillus arenilitoris TaxID=2772299 RepID=A0A927CM85_9BACL|nr:multicopper oxidase family protein [Paenibacillus arenilitoris]MBD2868180.1 multicopper oxidase family protein [Paenibacillus arenilitoris]